MPLQRKTGGGSSTSASDVQGGGGSPPVYTSTGPGTVGMQNSSSPPDSSQQISQLIIELLQQGQADQNMIMPLILASAGYKLVTDPETGTQQMVQMTPQERMQAMSPQERAQYQMQKTLMEREKQALEGTLPLPVAVQQQLDEQGAASQLALSQKLGPNANLSTPGIQSAAAQDRNRLAVEDAFRRGEVQLGMGLLGQNQGLINNTNQYNTGTLSGYANRNMGMIGGYQAAMQPYESALDRAASLSAARMNARAQETAGMYGLLGTLGGAYLGSL